MLKKILNASLIISIFYSNLIFADTLFEGASKRGINETCALYLGQVENTYDLQGLNITFAHQRVHHFFLPFIFQRKNLIMAPLLSLQL